MQNKHQSNRRQHKRNWRHALVLKTGEAAAPVATTSIAAAALTAAVEATTIGTRESYLAVPPQCRGKTSKSPSIPQGLPHTSPS